MIAVDTNILVYAHREDVPWFETASASVRDLAEAGRPWAIPWPCIHEFLAIVTHPRIFVTPTPLERAIDQVRAWMESPALALLGEGPAYWDRLSGVLLASRVGGPAVHDARIAALCLANGVSELWSADRDFGRFPALKVRNPLVSR
jgi:toxin-antitoxin system PIN domain toxin